MTSKQCSDSPKSVSECDVKPKFWDDNEKMEAWFAPFRNRELNPLNYDNKMMFWKDNAASYCNYTKKCFFTLNQLKMFYVRNEKMPSCLNIVLEDLLREGIIQDLNDYENSVSNNSWVGWTVNKLVNSPLKWSLKKVASIISPPAVEIDENTEYVHFPSLKKQAEDLYHVVSCAKNTIFTYDSIKELYSTTLRRNIDLKIIRILVRWLEMDGKASIHFENKHCHVHLIKFKSENFANPKISETEISTYILQQKELSLMEKLKKLETEKQNLREETKNYLKQKMRTMATNTLRKQKEIEKRITKLCKVLENIQNLLHRVQDTEADSQILESYKVGADALKSRMQTAGLDLDNVDRTMDEIEKALDMHNDIQETLGQTVGFNNEAELESELAELLLDDIPSVPPEPPSPGRKITGNIDIDDLPEVPDKLLHSSMRVELKRVET